MYTFDRFLPPSLRNEPRPTANCAFCGDTIYAGDDITAYTNGDITHRACEDAYCYAELGIVRTVAE